MDDSTKTEFSVSDKTTVNSQFVTDSPNDLVDQGNDSKVVSDLQDTVSYKTHEKLLNQHKKQQARLKELEEKEREREESEQLKRGEFEKVLSLKEEKIKNLQSVVEQRETERIEGKKLMAFMDKLPGAISDNDYLSHIDIDSIIIDENGEIDSLSLEKEVDRFTKKHWRVIDYKNKKGLPTVGHLGGRPNAKKSIKEMTREELRENYIRGNFN